MMFNSWNKNFATCINTIIDKYKKINHQKKTKLFRAVGHNKKIIEFEFNKMRKTVLNPTELNVSMKYQNMWQRDINNEKITLIKSHDSTKKKKKRKKKDNLNDFEMSDDYIK